MNESRCCNCNKLLFLYLKVLNNNIKDDKIIIETKCPRCKTTNKLNI